jgi:hypothetical protein
MWVAKKSFFLNQAPPPPAVLLHKVLDDVTVGRKEFAPPEWKTFKP